MTTNNIQQARKMKTNFITSKNPVNQSRLSNFLLTIGIGVIFLYGLLNLLNTSSVVVAEETPPEMLNKNPPIEASVADPMNNLPGKKSRAFVAESSSGNDGDLTVAMSETIYVDDIRTNLSSWALAGSMQVQVLDSTNFTDGQEILIMQMREDEIGKFETAVIDSVSNNILYLTNGLSNSYNHGYSDNVIVQVVPNYRTVTVQEGGTVTAHPWTGHRWDINTGGVLFFRAMTVTVAPGGQIVAEGLGFGAGEGPGAGTQGWSGTHGGGRLGLAYGDAYQPRALGSGGDNSRSTPSGSGGGILILDVTYLLQNDGTISANGHPGVDSAEPIGYFDRCGTGGSGGSVWIQTYEINGIGTIGAAGGDGGQCITILSGETLHRTGMAGTGGRIALYADLDQFSSETDAFQIFGGRSDTASPGTIYLNTNAYPEELWVDNDGRLSTYYPAVLVEGEYEFNRVRLLNEGSLLLRGADSRVNLSQGLLLGDGVTKTTFTVQGELSTQSSFEIQDVHLAVLGKLTADSLTTGANSKLSLYEQNPTHYETYHFNQITIGSTSTVMLYPVRNNDTNYTNDIGFHLNVDNLIIEPDGLLSASGLGYSANLGPGTGANSGDGAGHGGYDASGTGVPYGDIYQPIALGSGGRYSAGAGGGAIHIEAHTLQNDGIIAVNGADGYATTSSSCGGGGSGGSLWIDVAVISGTGVIEAFGGAGGDCSSYGTPNGFGGSGGRIALYAQDDTFSYRDNAYNVNGAGGAQPGTIYLDGYVSLTAHPMLLANGETTSLSVTVQANDGTLIGNKGVSLTVNSDVPTFMNDAGQLILATNGFYTLGETDSNGVITATMSSTETGDIEVIAWESGIWASPAQTIRFDVSRLSGAESDLNVIGDGLVAADGVTPVHLRVTARDQFGNPFSGVWATLQASDPTITATAVSTATNNEGFFDFEVRHALPGTAVFTATVSDESITETVPQTAVVTFVGVDLHVLANNLPSEQVAGLALPLPLTVRNEGYVLAENVVVTVSLPSQLNFNGPTNSDVVFDAANQQVIWTIGNLEANSHADLTIQTDLDASAPIGQEITTTVAAASTSTELNLGNNGFTHTLLVTEPAPHLLISPATSKHYLEVDQTASHTLTLANPGTAEAQGLNLETHYSWITLNTPALPQTLAIDETQAWVLELNTNGVPNGRYIDNIEIGGSNVPTQTIPTTVYIEDHAQNVTIKVANNADSLVNNATVTLIRNTERDVYDNNVFVGQESIQLTGLTNIKGELTIPYIPTGIYSMAVTAQKHDPFTTTVEINAFTTNLEAQLVAYPSLEFVGQPTELSVLAGGYAQYQLVVRNNGPGHAEGFSLQTPENLPWLSAALPNGIERLEAHEQMLVTILLNPEADQALTSYLTDPIIIDADNAEPDQVDLTIHVTTGEVGFLAFNINNQLAQPVEGAKVTIISQEERIINNPDGTQTVTRDWETVLSDANGEVIFNDLALTDYTFYVESEGYYVEQGIQTAQLYPNPSSVSTLHYRTAKPTMSFASHNQYRRETPFLQSQNPGQNSVTVTLEEDPFHITWSIEEITIEISYAFTVEIEYNSTLNAPAMFISPETFCTPVDTAGTDDEDWFIVNNGPMTMTNVIVFPHHADHFTFDVAGEKITDTQPHLSEQYFKALGIDIATNRRVNLIPSGIYLVAEALGPGEAITIPFTISSTVPASDIDRGFGWTYIQADYQLTNGEMGKYGNFSTLRSCKPGHADEETHWEKEEDGTIQGTGTTEDGADGLPRTGGSRGGGGGGSSFNSGLPTIPVNQDVGLMLQLGKMTMERQAFRGAFTLEELGGAQLENVEITIEIVDENGQPANSSFAINPGATVNFGSINGRESQEWLIVPDDLGLEAPTDYEFRAVINYTLNGASDTVRTEPATVTVYPLPEITLNYTHTQPTANGSFYVEIEAHNEGHGDARNFNVLLNETFVDSINQYGNISGTNRSLSFNLMEATVDGVPQSIENGYVFNFGTIPPLTKVTGRWQISVTTSDGSYMLDPVITRFAVKCRHVPYYNDGSLVELTSLINCDDYNDFIHIEDPEHFCVYERHRILGGPINTATGNYSYVQEGFDLPTMGDPLTFNWVYNSLNVGAFPGAPPIDSPLGRGWTYDYNMWLDLRASNVITLHTDTGTAVRINRDGDSLQAADEKWCADITVTDDGNGRSLYTVHSANQTTLVFSDTGKLVSRTDAQGNDVFFTYEEDGEHVSRVVEPVSGQSLDFSFDETTDRLELVTDSTGRTIDFVYDAASGLLSHVIDQRGQQWTYEYTQLPGGETVMYRVLDPDLRIVEETGFDEFGRAITQTYNGRSLAIEYDGQRRIVTDGNGGETVLFYDHKNLLVGERDALNNVDRYAFDINQNRIWHENKTDAPMNIQSNPDGYKTLVENALGEAFHFDYDDHNNMVYMQDAHGNETFYTYNEHNQPISVTNQLGGQVRYTYNDNGQVTSILNENGHLTQYGYDAWGRQTAITNALGYSSYTAYNEAWQVISTTDALGNITLYAYDATDNLIKMTENAWEGQPQNHLNAYNIVTEYKYDGRGNQTHVTDTLGFVTRSFYGPNNKLEGQITNWQGTIMDLSDCQFPPAVADQDLCTLYAYDHEENLILKTDPLGRQTRTFYNLLNQMTGRITSWDGVMTLETCQFPPPVADQNLCTLYQYNEIGNQILVTNTVGLQTRTFYDELNRTVGEVVNWQGTITDLSGCQFPPVEADKDLCVLYEHDEVGQVIITTDPLGRQTRTFYDALGRVEGRIENWQPGFALEDCELSSNNLSETNICTLYEYDQVGNQTVTTNALGQKTLTVYDPLNRSVARVMNWDGVTEINEAAACATLLGTANQNVCSTTSYDALGRTLQTTDALGNTNSRAYDPLGRVLTTTVYLSGTLVETVNSYDALGRQTSSRDPRGHVIHYTHDDLGRALTATSAEGVVSTNTYDAAGRVVQTTDGLNQATVQEYDGLNRPVRVIDAEGNAIEREYDAAGNLLVSIDAEGVRTEHKYDDLNRLTAVIENAGGTTANSSNIRTEYTYDALGNQLTTVADRILDDGQTEVERTEYDQLNRPVRTIDQLNHSTEMVYDAIGNTRVITDANGEVTLFTYDGLNRTTSINYVADGQIVAYTYDAVGNTRVMTDGIGTTQYTYDDLYRLTKVINPYDQPVSYAYDLNGNRTQLTYPDGKVVSYTYNADNRLSTVTDWLSGTTQYEYDVVGRLITTTFSNGVISTQQYDNANRLTGLRYEQADGTTIADYTYTLNKLGFREAVSETIYLPETAAEVHAFIEQNGLLVMEAEHGEGNDAATTHTWAETAVLPDYSGESYLQAAPDIGERYQTNNVHSSPQHSYIISITNAADYTLWIRGMAPDAAGDSIHVGLNGNVLAEATNLTGFSPREWSWTAVTMDNLTATVGLTSTNFYTLDLWMREDGLRIDQLLLTDDPGYVPPIYGLVESPYELITSTSTAGYLSSWGVAYEYDSLQRLTSATYAGDISATFKYTYDPVGNMTAYTETITTESGETETRQVTRHFNDANEMIVSTDSELGTTSYYYDLNGNLIEILPAVAGSQPRVRYSYDQRNLMLTSEKVTLSGSFTPRMAYDYDGNGQRLRLVDYGTVEGQVPIVTTFTNDVTGLSQVLLSDDGTTQTTMLYGADLIGSTSSDTSAELHLSLADALGSVRTEMVAAEVSNATTYGPYGNLFHYVGEAGTVYGFTGEETDSTGLIYLRARYYNPALRLFMSRDPFDGHQIRPQSQNGYSYVEGNPVNYTDPTGEVVDTLWDLYVFTEDAKVVWFDIQRPGCGNLQADLLTLAGDAFFLLLPFVPRVVGHVSDLVRGSTVLETVDDAADAVHYVETLGDGATGAKVVIEPPGYGIEAYEDLAHFLDDSEDWVPASAFPGSSGGDVSAAAVPVNRASEVDAIFFGLPNGSWADEADVTLGRRLATDVTAVTDDPIILGRTNEINEYISNLPSGEYVYELNISEELWTQSVNRGFIIGAAEQAIENNRPILLASNPNSPSTHFSSTHPYSVTSYELAMLQNMGFTIEPFGNIWKILPP